MPNKKSKQESVKVALASVRKEMAEPRMAPSIRVEEVKRQGHGKGQKANLAKMFRVSRNSFQRSG